MENKLYMKVFVSESEPTCEVWKILFDLLKDFYLL